MRRHESIEVDDPYQDHKQETRADRRDSFISGGGSRSRSVLDFRDGSDDDEETDIMATPSDVPAYIAQERAQKELMEES